MKIIYPDCIYAVAAITENADYPAVNVLDDLPQKPWLSTALGTDGLTLTTSGASVSGLFLGTTNADSGTIAIKNASRTVTYETLTLSGSWGRFFVKFSNTYNQVLSIDINLAITGLSDPISVGICRCGTVVDLPDPQYGFSQKRSDFSIVHEMSNGSLSVIKKDTPRNYENLRLQLSHAEFDAIDGVYDLNGKLPVAVLLSDNINLDDQWSGFFHMMDPPTGNYDFYQFAPCGLSLREAV